MSCPFNSTVPAARAPRTTSCMRFKQRMNVLLPQPEGPMMAVMWLAATPSETFSIALRLTLYQALTSRAHIPARGGSCSTGSGRGGASKLASMGSPTDGPAGQRTEHADQRDEYERAAPGLGLPTGIGCAGVVI